jgi:outer membrane protein assembly factor BamB
VLCFDAATDQEIWQHHYESRYTISYPLGPRATPTVDGKRVYTLGAMGHLFCFDAATGDVNWQKYLPEDFGTQVPVWGMAGAPLVDGEQLIVLAGGTPGAMVVSLDKRTGKERWRALEGKEPGYCAPVIAGMTIATPRTVGNRLFVTGFYSGPLMIDLGPGGNSPDVLWRTKAGNNERKNDSLHAVMCTPIVTEKYVYGVGSYGDLRCLDADTGEIVWETRKPTGNDRWWNAFLVPQGDRVVICNEQGDVIFARLTPDGYHELSRAKLIEPTQPIQRRMTVWSHPAFAMQSVFARNDGELIRVNLAAR